MGNRSGSLSTNWLLRCALACTWVVIAAYVIAVCSNA
jgi:hypothetical protein